MGERHYTLLIVDDEPIIADGLKFLFEEETQLQLDVRTAYTVSAALRQFEQDSADIVLSDIRMPEMSGLEMAEKLKAINPEVKLIFLSGYDHFEYAYQAIKQEAVDYILKTEGDGKVVQTVKSAIERMERERRQSEEYFEVSSRLSAVLPSARHRFLLDAAVGNLTDPVKLEEALAGIGEELSPKQRVVLLLGRVVGGGTEVPNDKTVQSVVERLLDHHLRPELIASVTHSQDFLWYVALEGEPDDRSSRLVHLLEHARAALKEQTGCVLSFAVASGPVGWIEVHAKYEALKRAFSNHALAEREGIVVEGDFREERMTSEEEHDLSTMLATLYRKIDVLELYLEQGQYHRFESEMELLCASLRKVRYPQSFQALELYLAVARAILSHLNRSKRMPLLTPEIDLSLLFAPDRLSGWQEKADYLLAIARRLGRLDEERKPPSAEATVGRIKEHIHHRLSSDLSLSALAQATGFNPTYLSRLFKKHAGVGLHEYISECRIELAKSLLSGTRLKIYEIAAKCGYDNPTYFVKTFKSSVGQTPQEYRDRPF
ncbi:response regulator [Cohnella sp.]|uniref:response regulator n=1 Tax=Cohnella sp. TaxID=1883426 RepID=UPI0035679338